MNFSLVCPFSKASGTDRSSKCDDACRLFCEGKCLFAEYLKLSIKSLEKQDK